MKKTILFSVIAFMLLLSCGTFRKKPSPAPAEKKPVSDEIIAENYVSDGIDFYKAKKYEQAVTNWKKALRLIPKDAEVYNFAGLAFHRLGELDSAITYFEKAVHYDDQYYQAWNNLGYMHFLKSEYQAALPYFDRSLKENPYYEQARLNRKKTIEILQGDLKIKAFELVQQADKLDSLELKIRNYRRALQVDSGYVDAWNNLGVAYYYYGKTDSAVYCIKKALDLNPDYPPAHNNAGYILDAGGDYDQAVRHYQKAIELRPLYVVALANLVDTYVHKKDYLSARQIMEALRENFPENELVRERMKEYPDLLKEDTDKGGE